MLAFFVSALAMVPAACSPTTCACTVCADAITLTVVDSADAAVNTFGVEATVNGNPVANTSNCDPGVRGTNTCSFGTELGVYDIVVRAPGFATKELAARFASDGGTDCCVNCAPNTLVDAVLIAE